MTDDRVPGDRRVPGYPFSVAVTPAEVAAAKLHVKRARRQGLTVEPDIAAIANAAPMPLDVVDTVDEGTTAGQR